MGLNNVNELNAEKIVHGANQLAHFNVRCPGCHKLFRVDSREIKSSSPHFDCTSCKTRFTFDFPPISASRIETRVVSLTEAIEKVNRDSEIVSEKNTSLPDGVDREEIALMADLKKCPKCSAHNPKLTKECLKCGVIFEKVEDLPLDSSLGAIPSLVKAWQDLMSDYTNAAKHVEFVDRCEDLQALPFALKKYQTLKEVQPMDSVAQEMLHQVLMRKFSKQVDRISGVPSFRLKAKELFLQLDQQVIKKINWVRVRKLSPFALSLSLMIVGLSNNAARNMVGMGAAILFLTLGLTLFIKGRISLEDFW